VKHYAWKFYHMPYLPVVPIALKFFEWKTGAKINEVDVYKAAGNLKNTPVLLIGSENDRQVPLKAMDSDGVDIERAISFLSETIITNNE